MSAQNSNRELFIISKIDLLTPRSSARRRRVFPPGLSPKMGLSFLSLVSPSDREKFTQVNGGGSMRVQDSVSHTDSLSVLIQDSNSRR